MLYFATKGLFIRYLGDDKYVIQDVFGTSSIPFESSLENLDHSTKKISNTAKLVSVDIGSEFPVFTDFEWEELESYYVMTLDHALLECLAGKIDIESFYSVIGLFPVGYLELGYGDGAKSSLESLHDYFLKLCEKEDFPVRKEDVDLFLVTGQVKRISQDILSLLNRSISAYAELLKSHRDCIAKSHEAISRMDTNEIVHRGIDSHRAASSVTSLIISLCSSLDLSAKLVRYINSLDPLSLSYKTARDNQFNNSKRLKPNFLSQEVLERINCSQDTMKQAQEIIQFRNDLIHSTSALELERIYVGTGTEEIHKMPLYYSAQYARDCSENGQPVRFLGRDYFVGEKLDIEAKILSWMREVFRYHIEVGEIICSALSGKKLHE